MNIMLDKLIRYLPLRYPKNEYSSNPYPIDCDDNIYLNCTYSTCNNPHLSQTYDEHINV